MRVKLYQFVRVTIAVCNVSPPIRFFLFFCSCFCGCGEIGEVRHLSDSCVATAPVGLPYSLFRQLSWSARRQGCSSRIRDPCCNLRFVWVFPTWEGYRRNEADGEVGWGLLNASRSRIESWFFLFAFWRGILFTTRGLVCLVPFHFPRLYFLRVVLASVSACRSSLGLGVPALAV